jgi:hypothetical protein
MVMIYELHNLQWQLACSFGFETRSFTVAQLQHGQNKQFLWQVNIDNIPIHERLRPSRLPDLIYTRIEPGRQTY